MSGVFDSASLKPPMVLLLAGESRDAWKRKLEDAGFGVRSPGWLDAVTAARVERPDLVLVASDLPASAPAVLTMGFRSSGDFAKLPLAMVGMAEGEAAAHREQPLRADHYIRSPISAEALARDVHEAIRVGRVQFRRPPAQRAMLASIGASLVVLGMRSMWSGISHLFPGAGPLSASADAALLVVGVGLLAVALAVGFVSARRRPPTLRQWRGALGWAAFGIVQFPNVVGREHPILGVVALSLACVVGTVWARLGLELQPPPTPGWRRWYRFLLALFAALGIAPWAALAVVGRG